MTHSFFSLLCLLILPSLALGQETFSVSATIHPVYVNTAYDRLYLFPESDGQVVDPVFLDGNKGAFGYSAGLTVYYTYAPGWSVAAGIWYRQLATHTARLALAGEGTTSIRNRSLRIPILVNYRSSPKRLSPYYSLGLLTDIPFTARVVASKAGEPMQHLRLNAPAGPVFSALAGAGAVYQVDRNVALTLQPTATYKIGRFGGALTDNRYRTFELGLLTQLIYTF